MFQDSLLTIEKLGKNVASHTELPAFNHVDFLWGNAADKMIYDKIIDTLKYQ